MKRQAIDTPSGFKAKRPKELIPEYCDASPCTDENGSIIWPAASEAIASARHFLKEWYGFTEDFKGDARL